MFQGSTVFVIVLAILPLIASAGVLRWTGGYGLGAWSWALTALYASIPVLALIRFIRSRRTQPPGHCPVCGYDLRATPERCPECGLATEITENTEAG